MEQLQQEQIGLGATIYVTDNVGLVGGYKWTHYLGAEEVTTDFVGQHDFNWLTS